MSHLHIDDYIVIFEPCCFQKNYIFIAFSLK